MIEADNHQGLLRKNGGTQTMYQCILPPQSMAEVIRRYVFGSTSMMAKMLIPAVSNKVAGHATAPTGTCGGRGL